MGKILKVVAARLRPGRGGDPLRAGLGSTPAVLAAVHAGLNNGYGTTTLGANLSLLVPVPRAAGPYSSGLDIRSVSTNL
jgi:hypothetical protein